MKAREYCVVELSARIRGAEPEDVAGIVTLAGHLGLERAPRIAPPTPSCAYLVEDPVSRMPIAYAAALQTIFKPIYDLQLAMGEDALRRHAGDVLLTQVLEDLAARDAITLQHRTSARHAALVEFLSGRGFQVIERAQDWRLDATACAALASPTSPDDDWAFPDLAALSRDPALLDSVVALLTEAIADEPSERALLPIHPAALGRSLRVQRDGVLAISGGQLHGLITVSADDAVPGALRVNMIVVRKDRRGHGLASAMLACLLAKHHGTSVRLVVPAATDLTAWLAGRGFVRQADLLLLERLLRKTVPVAPGLLEEYAGRYVVEARPDAPILIERHDKGLISKTRDMRDLLLASSESEFFTRHHDARGRFERDGTGRVTRLVFNDGSRELIAIRS
jgi:N-acetylglutamate synthase-like GNAT family acetyltransferase